MLRGAMLVLWIRAAVYNVHAHQYVYIRTQQLYARICTQYMYMHGWLTVIGKQLVHGKGNIAIDHIRHLAGPDPSYK